MTTAAELQFRIRDDLERLARQEGVPGASVAFVSGSDAVDATYGVLDMGTRIPVEAGSLFQIQSITKVFTATLVMQLVDDGLVELAEPVQTYLPEFHTADATASEEMTLHHLLTHSGGFEGDLWEPTTSGPDALDRFVRDLVSQATQYSPPGLRFSYCSAGYAVLGRLVEILRGMTYEEALRQFLLRPLGIEAVAFSTSQAASYGVAMGHVRPGASSALRPSCEWALMPPSNPAAGNQLAMSANGLLTLGQLFLSEGVTPTGQRLLSKASAMRMLKPYLPHRNAVRGLSHQGFGWRLPRPGIAEHGGGAPGVSGVLTIAPAHGIAAVVLTNSDGGGRLARQLFEPLFADLAGIAPTPVSSTPGPQSLVSNVAPYLGQSSNRQSEFLVEDDAGGRLWLTEEAVNEGAAMERLAGAVPTSSRNEIRPVDATAFSVIGDDGRGTGVVTFLEPQPSGHFRLIAKERVAAFQS
ncbi:serine hydrolase domain-containing protein [Curtobacterium sp. SL109]|uniref:serine hydrolase domain-containing protein n=1 Tax=Curtobacterium sp. SL109 TaxID=2994662 RepID=UPI0022734FF1|nr:serine hydrolase domain-containing protein [Curtobacterium sp. SL109]MCY1692823.1 serine hydrolase [Curtobacterium sp. SL109]